MEQIYGLSFANNDFKIPESPSKTFSLIDEKNDQKYRANRLMYNETLANIESQLVDEKDGAVITNAINSYQNKLKPILESGRFERADFIIEDASREIANDKLLAGAVTKKKELDEWINQIYSSDAVGRTTEEKSAIAKIVKDSYTGVKLDENGVVIGGFNKAQIYDKADYNKVISTLMEDFVKTIIDTPNFPTKDSDPNNVLDGKKLIERYGSAGQHVLIQKLVNEGYDMNSFYEYMGQALANTPEVQQSIETDMLVDSGKSLAQLTDKYLKDTDKFNEKAVAEYNTLYAAAEKAGNTEFTNKYSTYKDYFLTRFIPKELLDQVPVKPTDLFAALANKEHLGVPLSEDDKIVLDYIKEGVVRYGADYNLSNAVNYSEYKFGNKTVKIEKFFTYEDDIITDAYKQVNDEGRDYFSIGGGFLNANAVNERYTSDNGYENYTSDIQTLANDSVNADKKLDSYLKTLKNTYNALISVDENGNVKATDVNNKPIELDTSDLKYLKSLWLTSDATKSELNAKNALHNLADNYANDNTPLTPQYIEETANSILQKYGIDMTSSSTFNINTREKFSAYMRNYKATGNFKNSSKDAAIGFLTEYLENPANTENRNDFKVALTKLKAVKDSEITALAFRNKKYREAYSEVLKANMLSAYHPKSVPLSSIYSSNEDVSKHLKAYITDIDMTIDANLKGLTITDNLGYQIKNQVIESNDRREAKSTFSSLEPVNIEIVGGKVRFMCYALAEDGTYITNRNGSEKAKVYVDADESLATSTNNLVTALGVKGKPITKETGDNWQTLVNHLALIGTADITSIHKAMTQNKSKIYAANGEPLGELRRVQHTKTNPTDVTYHPAVEYEFTDLDGNTARFNNINEFISNQLLGQYENKSNK